MSPLRYSLCRQTPCLGSNNLRTREGSSNVSVSILIVKVGIPCVVTNDSYDIIGTGVYSSKTIHYDNIGTSYKGYGSWFTMIFFCTPHYLCLDIFPSYLWSDISITLTIYSIVHTPPYTVFPSLNDGKPNNRKVYHTSIKVGK